MLPERLSGELCSLRPREDRLTKSVFAALDSEGNILSSEIADTVSTRVQSKFAGAAAGDKDALETYLEAVVKSMSNASYSGARKKAEYWWQIRKTTPAGALEDTYEYHLLVVVPKDVLDKQIQMALAQAGTTVKPKNEEEKTARDRVKKAFDDTGLGE
jgi:exoribonuclease II